jgi:hypothetical protein
VSRRPNDQAFTKTEVRRLMRIAEEHGEKKYRIVIGREDGRPKYTLIVGETESATEQTNEVDSWLEEHAR